MPLTVDSLSQAASRSRPSVLKSIREAEAEGVRTAFLCHSHKDQTLVAGLLALFDDSKWSVYVDWADPGLPPIPDRATARRIQGKIIETELFLFLATPNALNSRWCPWEIGYANGVKNIDTILVIPTQADGTIHGSEYLSLYRRIDMARQGKLAVWPAGESTGAVWLSAV
jgi:hypothetical protein